MSDITTTPPSGRAPAERARVLLGLFKESDAQSMESLQLVDELRELLALDDNPEVDDCVRGALENLIKRNPEAAFPQVSDYVRAPSLAPVLRAELDDAIAAIGTLGWSFRFLALLQIYGLATESIDASLMDRYARQVRQAFERYVPNYDDGFSELVLHELLVVQSDLWGGPLPDDMWNTIVGWHEAWQARLHRKHPRNEPCWCGSGKKYKKCCATSRPRSELPSWELEPEMRGAWPPPHLFEETS